MKLMNGKIFGVALALSMMTSSIIPQNVQAHSTTNYKMEVKSADKQIESAFNKFRYAMTVEWDQQDVTFKNNVQRDLEDALIELVKSGVSDKEILPL